MRYKITFSAIAVLLFACNAVYSQINFLDAGFGTNGISFSPAFKPAMAAFQADGKILVTGSAVTGSSTKLYRFNADGTLDLDFGNQGSAAAGNATSYNGVQQLADGKIVLVGKYAAGGMFGVSSGTVTFARFNNDGTADTSFGDNGILKIAEYAQQGNQQKIASVTKVKFLPDGSIVCAGHIGYMWVNPLSAGPISQLRIGPMVTRFNPDLTLDTSFAGTGYVKLPPTVRRSFTAMEVLPDGSVIAGFATSGNVVLYKYLANGNADTTFGTAGIKSVDMGTANDRVSDITITDDGKILLSGDKDQNGFYGYVARLHANGDLDETYGTGGILTLANSSGMNENAVETLVLDNGMTVTGMQKWDNDYDFMSVFTTPSGAIDTTVANSGVLFTGLPEAEKLTCLLQQPDGKLLAVGYNENNCVMMRYDLSSFLGVASFDKTKMAVYPNPAQDFINITGLPEGTVASIYNMSGQKLLETTINADKPIDISSLATGTYLLRTDKGAFKIIKK